MASVVQGRKDVGGKVLVVTKVRLDRLNANWYSPGKLQNLQAFQLQNALLAVIYSRMTKRK